MLLPVKAVGVMGDGRTHEQVVAIRAVESQDFMTADWARLPSDVLATISNRIINEGPRREPGGLRYIEQAAGNDRVGIIDSSVRI